MTRAERIALGLCVCGFGAVFAGIAYDNGIVGTTSGFVAAACLGLVLAVVSYLGGE